MSSAFVFRSESQLGSGSAFPIRRPRPAPIRKRHIVTKHKPRLSDGIKHPVTVRKIGE